MADGKYKPGSITDELLSDDNMQGGEKYKPGSITDRMLKGEFGLGEGPVPPPKQGQNLQYPDRPEFRASEAAGGRQNKQFATMMLSTLGAADDDQLADVAANVFDGKLSRDTYGHKMITLPDGQAFYINKPGFSQRDAVNVLSNILPFIPAGKLAMIPRGLAARFGTAAAGEAGTSALLDVGQTALGSKQGVDPIKAATTGLTAGAGSLLAGPAGKFFKLLTSRNKYYRNGALTPEGLRVAKAAGYDLDNLGPDLPRILGQNLRRAADEDTAIAMTAGKEFDLNLTAGEAFRNPKQLAREEAIRHGQVGEEAQRLLLERREIQRESLRDARQGLQQGFGGGTARITRPQEAFDIVSPGVQSRAEAADLAVGRAYQQVTDAEILGEGFKGLTKRLHDTVADHRVFVSPSLYPSSTTMLRETRKIERRINKRIRQVRKRGGDIAQVRRDFKDMESHRRFLRTKIDAANTKADRAAAVGIKREYDKWMDDMIDANMFTGSDDALALMKKARKTRSEYGNLFEARDRADRSGKVIEKIISGDRTPEQVMGYTFTTGKGEGVQVVRRLKNIFEPDSDEWLALKEAAWLRIAKETGTADVSPGRFISRLNKTLSENKTLMDEIFTPDEINTMIRFRDEVAKLIPPPEATRPSKTPYGVEKQVRATIRRIAQQRQLGRKPVQAMLLHWLGRTPTPGLGPARRALEIQPGRMKAPLFTATIAGQAHGHPEDVQRGAVTGAIAGSELISPLIP